MASSRFSVLQVNTSDKGGGAAAIAASLHGAFVDRGLRSWIAVGRKQSDDDAVLEIPNSSSRSLWERSFNRFAGFLDPLVRKVKPAWHVQKLFRDIGNPGRAIARFNGSEDFDYPGTWWLLALASSKPDILHLHNLHGDYFDLRALPWLSARVPTAVTLHDAWMLSGHCAHSFDCMRWTSGCGSCPDLSIPPAVARDDTAANWQRKRSIYSRSHLFVVTPSQWLMNKVEHSMLGPAVVEKRVIPNGVDLSIFKPGSKRDARKRLGLADDGLLLLFAANGIRMNPWKDFATMRSAIGLLATEPAMKGVVFLALGEEGPEEKIDGASIRFVPFQSDSDTVADYYRAADIYVHAALADTFPNTVIEALACGTPVVATATGGIPEQVHTLNMTGANSGGRDGKAASTGATGILVEPANPVKLAGAVRLLAADPGLRKQLAENAAADARARFGREKQVDAYLELYSDMHFRARNNEALRDRRSPPAVNQSNTGGPRSHVRAAV